MTKNTILKVAVSTILVSFSLMASQLAKSKQLAKSIGDGPYVSKLIHWELPIINTDGSLIVDFKGVNIYYSYNGPTNFVKGVTNENYLLSVINIHTNVPADLDPMHITQRELGIFNGSFSNDTLWVRATSFDQYGNESDFSDFATSTLLNVGLTNASHVITIEANGNGLSILLSESDGTETLQTSTNLVTGGWLDAGPLRRWYSFEELGISNKYQFFRAIRTVP